MVTLEEVKNILNTMPDSARASGELEIVNQFTQSCPEESTSLLEWVYSKSQCCWNTRVKVALELNKFVPNEVWIITQNLINSSDPDDRGTALTFLEESKNPRGPALALDFFLIALQGCSLMHVNI